MRTQRPLFTMRKDGRLPTGDWFSVQNAASANPKVYIYDEIGFWGTEASDFVKVIEDIDADTFELHINSPGGEIFDGLAIYNAIKAHKATVTVYVDGLAASAASYIAQAGDKVVMARNAQMMIHDGIGFAYGNEAAMLRTAATLSRLSDNIADIYALVASKRGSERSMEDWRDLMREELWMNGREAVAEKLADEVLDDDEDDEVKDALNKWDLGFYNYAGRDKADSPLRVAQRVSLDNKENQMSSSSTEQTDPNETGTGPEQTEPVKKEVESPTGDPEETGSEAQTTDPAEPVQPPVAPPSNSGAQNGVMIDGKLVTDFAEINRHFANMQAANKERQDVTRKTWVENLARDGKIAAPMIDSLVTVVNGDPSKNVPAMSDESFAAFQASYESAPASTLFDQHGSTDNSSTTQQVTDPSTGKSVNKADRKKDLEAIVSMHSRTMTPEQVQQTNSYKELQQLLAQN